MKNVLLGVALCFGLAACGDDKGSGGSGGQAGGAGGAGSGGTVGGAGSGGTGAGGAGSGGTGAGGMGSGAVTCSAVGGCCSKLPTAMNVAMGCMQLAASGLDGSCSAYATTTICGASTRMTFNDFCTCIGR